MRRAARGRTITTRLAQPDYERLLAQLGPQQTPSEWLRDVVLRALEHCSATPTERVLLAELVALRAIVISLLARMAGDGLPAGDVEAVIARADGLRWSRAAERLTGTPRNDESWEG